jgi:hypothetical protein
MSDAECPKCHLPKDDSAWQCDGCGYAFRQDFDNVRTELQAELRRARITVWLTIVLGLAIVGGLVYLATRGFLYVSVPLLLAVVGWTGHAVHRVSVLRDHLESLNRRHVPLPKATAQRVP